MQVTTPEDVQAIKDIEKQLLFSTESLCKTFAEPHSPGYTMGKNTWLSVFVCMGILTRIIYT